MVASVRPGVEVEEGARSERPPSPARCLDGVGLGESEQDEFTPQSFLRLMWMKLCSINAMHDISRP